MLTEATEPDVAAPADLPEPPAPAATSPSLDLLRSIRKWLRIFVITWLIVLGLGVIGAIRIAVVANRDSAKAKSDLTRSECLARRATLDFPSSLSCN